MKSNKLKDLVGQIRESLPTASLEHKHRLITMLEQHINEDKRGPEELQASLAKLEQLEAIIKQAVKTNYWVVDEVHSNLWKELQLVNEIDPNDVRTLNDALERGYRALRTAQQEITNIENAIKQEIKELGWKIHDAEDENLDEDELDEDAYNRGYKDYQLKQDNAPRKTSPKHKHYQAGYRAAAADSKFRQ